MKYVKKITGWVFGILFILVLLAMGLTHLMEQQTTLSELTDHFDTTGFQPEEHKTVLGKEHSIMLPMANRLRPLYF